jgi:hypothetical protein
VEAVNLVTLDFESLFDDELTLKKLSTEEYCRHERFEVHGCAFHTDAATWWADADDVGETLESIPRPVAVLCHHAHFDGLILSHVYGWKPDFWLDTLSMGRVCFDAGLKLGLDSLASRFGLNPKTVPYDQFKGKHWGGMPVQLQHSVASGAMHDCVLTRTIFDRMMTGCPEVPYPFPPSELPVIDMTVRMFTEPALIGDSELLGQAWTAEEKLRADLFARLGVTAQELRKDDTFAAMLEELGVEPEAKTTTKGNTKYAFAKSDRFMQDLLTDADEDVALLAEARLKAQSSIYQTRVERLGWAASRGPLPVYLSYCAAHTRRWGGGDKVNWQNFPRPDPSKPQKGAIRRAIKAP